MHHLAESRRADRYTPSGGHEPIFGPPPIQDNLSTPDNPHIVQVMSALEIYCPVVPHPPDVWYLLATSLESLGIA